MDREGFLEPDTEAEARDQFALLAPAAETVVKEAARQMGFDRAEFDARITDDVTDAAQESLFASLLVVSIGTRAEYEQWCADHRCEAIEVGTENVDNAVWHAAPFSERVVAATFQDEREAAVGTLRRQAFGRLYREVLE